MAKLRIAELSRDARVSWIGVASADPERARTAAQSSGAHRWGRVDDILDEPLSAVVIASANTQHADHLSRCIDLNVPIFCEKPLAATLEESDALVRAAERAGTPIQVGFQRRLDSGYQRAHKLITSEALGKLYSIRLMSHDHKPPPESYMPTSGGLFRDLGVHDFDLARWLSGEEVVSVSTTAANRSEYTYFADYGDPDVAVVTLTMTSGLPVVVSLAWHNGGGHDVRAEITGAKDTLAVGYDARAALTYAEQRDPITVTSPRYDDYVDRFSEALGIQTKSFIDFVSGDGPNPCPGKDGVQAVRIAVAAERSLAEGRPILVASL
jgi:myo-inositol 2-dehydrogenase/D-chiro-inositol 1-dehydrogenase